MLMVNSSFLGASDGRLARINTRAALIRNAAIMGQPMTNVVMVSDSLKYVSQKPDSNLERTNSPVAGDWLLAQYDGSSPIFEHFALSNR